MLKHKPGTLTGNNEDLKFFANYGVPILWRTSENIRICARVFGVKRMGVLQVNVWACERVKYANFFLRGTV